MGRTNIDAYSLYKRYDSIMECLKLPITVRQISEKTNLPRESVERFLNLVIKAGDIEVVNFVTVGSSKTRVMRLKSW